MTEDTVYKANRIMGALNQRKTELSMFSKVTQTRTGSLTLTDLAFNSDIDAECILEYISRDDVRYELVEFMKEKIKTLEDEFRDLG